MSAFQPILTTIRTKGDVDHLVHEVDLLLEGLFRLKNGSFEELLKTSVRLDTKDLLVSVCQKEGIDSKEGEKIKKFLEDLKEEILKLKAFKITLAFDPTEKTINKLSSWVKINMGENIILEIEKDTSLLGGAVFVNEGKYMDFSLRKKIEEVFENKKEEIASAIS